MLRVKAQYARHHPILHGLSCRYSTPLRHYLPYICGRIILTHHESASPTASRSTRRQAPSVHDPKERAPLSDDNVGIRGGSVGPLRRNRANRAVIDAQQQPLAEPIIAFADAHELPPGDRMKRMGHADKLRRSRGKGRIPYLSYFAYRHSPGRRATGI